METQSRRIDDLVERVRQQQDKLDKQNVRLQALQAEVKKKNRLLLHLFKTISRFNIFCILYHIKSIFTIYFECPIDTGEAEEAEVCGHAKSWRLLSGWNVGTC